MIAITSTMRHPITIPAIAPDDSLGLSSEFPVSVSEIFGTDTDVGGGAVVLGGDRIVGTGFETAEDDNSRLGEGEGGSGSSLVDKSKGVLGERGGTDVVIVSGSGVVVGGVSGLESVPMGVLSGPWIIVTVNVSGPVSVPS